MLRFFVIVNVYLTLNVLILFYIFNFIDLMLSPDYF
jgi:hypothetical protein